MKLVVDANVLFSALLKESATRALMSDSRLELFSPAFILTEFSKYRPELQERTKLKANEFHSLEKILLNRLRFVEDAELLIFGEAAQRLVSDQKDVPYIACALAVNADVWSNDRHFENPRIKVWTTRELQEKLYPLSGKK